MSNETKAPQPPAEAQRCPCGQPTCVETWEPGCGMGNSDEQVAVEAQPVAWRFWAPEILGVPYKEWTGWSTDEGFRKHAEGHGWAAEYAYRSDAPSAPLGNSGAVSALRVLSDFNPGADEFTDALSCLQGYFEQAIQSDQLNDLSDAIELPDGFRVVEHLPGIWEYQFDIEDEADEDSDRRVSGTSWNHPALAAIAAWQHAYDEAKSQPPSAPVGVEGLPEGWMRDRKEVVALAEHLEGLGWKPDERGDVQCFDQGSAMAAEVIRRVLIPILDGAPTVALAQQPAAASPSDVELAQGPDDIPRLLIAGREVAEFPTGSWAEVCEAFDFGGYRNEQPAAVGGGFDRTRFRKAPCYLCGYDGAGYFQPATHPCAALYHAAQQGGGTDE